VHAYLGLGAVARVDKDFEEAIRVYSRAAELQPGFPLAYYGRGVSHYKLGQYRAAAVDFQQTIRLAPASSDLAQDSTAYLEAMAESVNGQ
jgi:tetratricopeptide (TPR) repeat protein